MSEPHIVLNFKGPQMPWNHLFLAYNGAKLNRPHAVMYGGPSLWAFTEEVHMWFESMGFDYALHYEQFHIAERIIMVAEENVFMAFKLAWTP